MCTPLERYQQAADAWSDGIFSSTELMMRFFEIKGEDGRALTGDDLKTRPEAMTEIIAMLNTPRYGGLHPYPSR